METKQYYGRAVMQLMRSRWSSIHWQRIADLAGIPDGAAQAVIMELVAAGEIQHAGNGRYELNPEKANEPFTRFAFQYGAA